VRSSETLVPAYQVTLRLRPDDGNLS